MADSASEGAEMSFQGRMSYGDYLSLDRILTAQQPRSTQHDEMLFIIQHQTSELWIKLAIHELRAAMAAIAGDDLKPAFKMLTRVARIFEQLNSAWDVLRTMTPTDYTSFRDALGQSSGFQSWQYRMVEFLVGNRNLATLGVHDHRPELMAELEAVLGAPSLYDEAIRLLQRQGVDVGDETRDWRENRQPSTKVTEAWRQVYLNPGRYWELYDLAEKLVDFEDYFRRWRFNHVTTVERIIGMKRGSGGTSGVAYLRKMLEVELFPELWQVRALL